MGMSRFCDRLIDPVQFDSIAFSLRLRWRQLNCLGCETEFSSCFSLCADLRRHDGAQQHVRHILLPTAEPRADLRLRFGASGVQRAAPVVI